MEWGKQIPERYVGDRIVVLTTAIINRDVKSIKMYSAHGGSSEDEISNYLEKQHRNLSYFRIIRTWKNVNMFFLAKVDEIARELDMGEINESEVDGELEKLLE